jgi:hypothetical protein
MADLGDTQYVGLSQPERTPAQTFATQFQDSGLYAPFPSSSFLENEIGNTSEAFNRVLVPNVVRPAAQHVFYEMRGRDQDCATLTYRYWRVVGAADMSASQYAGPKCGSNPLVDVTVLEVSITT